MHRNTQTSINLGTYLSQEIIPYLLVAAIAFFMFTTTLVPLVFTIIELISTFLCPTAKEENGDEGMEGDWNTKKDA